MADIIGTNLNNTLTDEQTFGIPGFRRDKIAGLEGHDTILITDGNDTVFGGSGNDTITDFDAGSAKTDVIRLDKSVLSSFNDVLSHASDSSGGVVIDYGNSSIKLSGVDKADLHANDFFFF